MTTEEIDADPTEIEELVTYENRITPKETEESGLPSWAESWRIFWSDLIVDDHVLGSGNFGEVRSGSVIKDREMIKSAIKMLKGKLDAVLG